MVDVAFTAPHADAAELGLSLLREGASAVDAVVAAAAAIGVLYPHMNSPGGDGFWLLQRPGCEPVAIDACGGAAGLATLDEYRGCEAIPSRGGRAALCMAGTLDGWRLAREWSRSQGAAELPLSQLLAPAAELARKGVTVTGSLQAASEKVDPELNGLPGYGSVFRPFGRSLRAGDVLRNPALGHFFERVGCAGTEDFYRGDLARELAEWLARNDSPLRLDDFRAYRARRVRPLSARLRGATLFNLPAPTQGVASLLILAILDRYFERCPPASETEYVHAVVEATKRAFRVRDREVADPSRLSPRWPGLLDDGAVAAAAADIDPARAQPWPFPARPGDTVWMGAADRDGCLVSFIQSVYWEFGAGLVHPELGVVWNNRGHSFSLQPEHINALGPGLKPFHTLNPAMAVFDDGRRMVYGTMGGEGQPQTQAALFSRYHYLGRTLESAVADGRWLLGRTWGDVSHDLKLEGDLHERVAEGLQQRGHELRPVPVQSEMMGHAGAVCLFPQGGAVATSDPRSDGAAPVAPFPATGGGP